MGDVLLVSLSMLAAQANERFEGLVLAANQGYTLATAICIVVARRPTFAGQSCPGHHGISSVVSAVVA